MPVHVIRLGVLEDFLASTQNQAMKCTTRSLALAGVFIVLGMLALGYYLSDDMLLRPAPAPASLSSSSVDDDGIFNHSDDLVSYA